MPPEQLYRRKEFAVGIKAGILAFARDKPDLKSEDLHMSSSYVEHWHESDWMELPVTVKGQITLWVDAYRSNVERFETTKIHTEHMSQYSLQILQDIGRALFERHVIVWD